ncbi:MAG: hypothetical protein LBS59_04505, partial [Puniceicoccales bacterium]|jgi:uncharacterized coiled-coil DUF342 family protein|nr:hypothetical protein [Puniceicoccales bacterium]
MKVAFPFVGGERLNDARQKVSDLAASLAGMKAARDAGDETEELATKIKVAEQDARAAQAALNALNKTVDAQKVAMIRAGVAAEEYRKRATAIADLQNSFKGLAAGVDRFKDSFGKTVTLLRNSTMRLAGLTAASVVFAFCCRTGFEP